MQVVGSRPDTLLHNFATLLPGATSSDFQRIVELKVAFYKTLDPHPRSAAEVHDALQLSVHRGAQAGQRRP